MKNICSPVVRLIIATNWSIDFEKNASRLVNQSLPSYPFTTTVSVNKPYVDSTMIEIIVADGVAL